MIPTTSSRMSKIHSTRMFSIICSRERLVEAHTWWNDSVPVFTISKTPTGIKATNSSMVDLCPVQPRELTAVVRRSNATQIQTVELFEQNRPGSSAVHVALKRYAIEHLAIPSWLLSGLRRSSCWSQLLTCCPRWVIQGGKSTGLPRRTVRPISVPWSATV